MRLVMIFCAAPGCERLLSTIEEPLPAWVSTLPRSRIEYAVRPCPDHGATLAGFRRLARQPGRTVSLGLGSLRVQPVVLWTLIDEAWRTGRTQKHTV